MVADDGVFLLKFQRMPITAICISNLKLFNIVKLILYLKRSTSNPFVNAKLKEVFFPSMVMLVKKKITSLVSSMMKSYYSLKSEYINHI